MNEKIAAPVTIEFDEDGDITLSFGPMPIEELAGVLTFLSSEEGMADFIAQSDAAIKAQREGVS